MNIFYFVNRWPKNKQCSRSQKIYSMIQTFINIGHKVFLLSSDTSPTGENSDLDKIPIETVYINPNKIATSLASATKKPDLVLFNSYLMEQMYSIFLYSKYNRCPRILEINQLYGLQNWRKRNYTMLGSPFLQEYDSLATPPQNQNSEKFNTEELQSIKRSDFYFCGNDFISHNLQNNLKLNNYIINSMGLPITDFKSQVTDLQFRDYRHRKHFVFFGNLSIQKNVEMIDSLITHIWPLIRTDLNNVQLHIYGSGFNKNLQAKKKDLQKIGIYLKGKLQDSDQIQRYRALLYPVRYTTGTKGVIVQSWFQHTPVVTTPIGAEGLFMETSQPLFSANQKGQISEGFFKEKILTQEEEQGKIKIKNYYLLNRVSDKVRQHGFGGLCDSWTYHQFAKNAVKIYNDETLWNKCLVNSRKSFLKHHSELQLEVNLRYGISQVQLAVYESRRKKQYNEQWDKYIKSKDGYNRLHEKAKK